MQPKKYMDFKYGQSMRPDEIFVKVDNTFKEVNGQFTGADNVIYYSFTK